VTSCASSRDLCTALHVGSGLGITELVRWQRRLSASASADPRVAPHKATNADLRGRFELLSWLCAKETPTCIGLFSSHNHEDPQGRRPGSSNGSGVGASGSAAADPRVTPHKATNADLRARFELLSWLCAKKRQPVSGSNVSIPADVLSPPCSGNRYWLISGQAPQTRGDTTMPRVPGPT